MSRPRILLVLSWLLATAIIGVAIFSTPYMRGVLRGEAVESAGESIGALLFLAAICGWPWLLAFLLPHSPRNNGRRNVFSLVAVGITAAFYIPISTGHDFEIGAYTILCILAIWVAYPVTRILVPKKPANQSINTDAAR
jgi:hypothetical protein